MLVLKRSMMAGALRLLRGWLMECSRQSSRGGGDKGYLNDVMGSYESMACLCTAAHPDGRDSFWNFLGGLLLHLSL